MRTLCDDVVGEGGGRFRSCDRWHRAALSRRFFAREDHALMREVETRRFVEQQMASGCRRVSSDCAARAKWTVEFAARERAAVAERQMRRRLRHGAVDRRRWSCGWLAAVRVAAEVTTR
jgi:hypothetical protein